MYKLLAIAGLVAMISACGGRTIDVDYNPEAQYGGSDWYPIPAEGQRRVTSAERVVERPPLRVIEPVFSANGDGLTITEEADSFGNASLVVNRDADFTWELLDAAVTRLDWQVADRNRSEYRLELRDPNRRSGFFGWLRNPGADGRQSVRLILVPKVASTGISAVYADDEVLSAEDNQELISQLKAELLQGQ